MGDSVHKWNACVFEIYNSGSEVMIQIAATIYVGYWVLKIISAIILVCIKD